MSSKSSGLGEISIHRIDTFGNHELQDDSPAQSRLNDARMVVLESIDTRPGSTAPSRKAQMRSVVESSSIRLAKTRSGPERSAGNRC